MSATPDQRINALRLLVVFSVNEERCTQLYNQMADTICATFNGIRGLNNYGAAHQFPSDYKDLCLRLRQAADGYLLYEEFVEDVAAIFR